jgi:hypothetical protein
MAVVQSTYSERMPIAVAGMPADMRAWDGISRNVETAAGIGFGLAVSRGSTSAELGAILGGTVTAFLGVSLRDVTLEANATPDEYQQNVEMGILTNGTVWVEVSGSPDPTDPVHFNASTGVFAASGGSGPVLGARFVSNTITGQFGKSLCKLHLPNYNQAGA